jgi:hypothetical protein
MAEPQSNPLHESLSRFVTYAVALPIAHLVLASMFLWGYSVGYGGRVAMFIDISDIFRVSIADLAYVYWSVIMGLAWFWFNLEQTKASAHLAKPKPTMILVSVLGIAGIAGPLLPPILPIPMTDFAIWLSLISLGVIIFAVINRVVSPQAFLAVAMVYLFSSSWLNGADRGEVERGISYQTAQARTPLCGRAALIRRFSDFYLAVLQNNQKVMIDSECKLRFVFRASATRPHNESWR